MTIVYIKTTKEVKKSKREYEKEKKDNGGNGLYLVSEYKSVELKEPMYIVEMSAKEIQVVSFYLELENRKPIVNVEIDAKLEKGKLKDGKN